MTRCSPCRLRLSAMPPRWRVKNPTVELSQPFSALRDGTPDARRRCCTWRELQGDSVAQPRGRRSVVEDTSKVASTAAAMHLRSPHKQGAIFFDFGCVRQWPIKARPPGEAVELRCRGEQGQVAARTRKRSLALFMIERARSTCPSRVVG